MPEGYRNKQIIDFFNNLDRSFFIDNENKSLAGHDVALAIGYEQTISQPSLVLEMTLQLDLQEDSRVLEIGTGSGYQTALLAEFAAEVYTVERIPQLLSQARRRLQVMGYTNIYFRPGDGSEGWEDFAPYDRIIVTAAAEIMPQVLLKQLKPGGKMIIPVGRKGSQDLMLVMKDANNQIRSESLGKVTFVEFRGKYGWSASGSD